VDASLVLIGVGSDGHSVEQWDGHKPPAGVMLRWFPPDDLGHPDLGFDVYRANVGDVVPMRFDNAAVAALAGKRSAEVDGRFTLTTSDPAGLAFVPYRGSNALLVPANGTLTLDFPGLAWDLYLGAATFGAGLTAEVFAAGASRGSRPLPPGAQENWRSRGLARVVLTGDGALASVGYRLVDAPYQWSLLAHRGLPVSAPGYPDPGKPAAGTEADEARSRLPADAGGDWPRTYGPHFGDLLPTLTALATHQGLPVLAPPADPHEPRVATDPVALFRAALVDPHIGRIAGLAYDDVGAAALRQLLAYKVVGTWYGPSGKAHVGDKGLSALNPTPGPVGPAIPRPPLPVPQLPIPQLPRPQVPVRVPPVGRPATSIDADLGTGGTLPIRFGIEVAAVSVDLTASGMLTVVALDAAGAELASTRFKGRGTARLAAAGIAAIELRGAGTLSITAFGWRLPDVRRYGLIPGIAAADPGAPTGPGWVTATRVSGDDSRRVEVGLDWDTTPPGGPQPEYAAVGAQVAGVRFGADPWTPRPAVPAFSRAYLLREGASALTPPDLAAAPPPRVLLRDSGPTNDGLTGGWYAWWVRGVDLFGRCAQPSPPALLAVVDDTPPPPPSLVLAEQIQADLPDTLLTVLGRSPLAAGWLAAHPTQDALAVCLAWTPELAELAPDVDAFNLYVRRPNRLAPTDQRDPVESYDGVPWGNPVTAIGPVPTRLAGTVTAVGDSVQLTVSAVAALPVVDPADPPAFRLTTDLALDTGSGELAGAVLTTGGGVVGGAAYDVVANGEGPAAALTVTAATAPTTGPYALVRGTSGLRTVDTGVAPPALDPYHRAYAGTLSTATGRLRVLGHRGTGTLVCADDGTPPPATGSTAVWFPAWALTVADTGFGPTPEPGNPVARAQVSATAVRRAGTPHAVESAPATPASVLAVDTAVPPPPELPDLPADPDAHCVCLATRADWYGISRFTLAWTPAAGTSYVVLRALADAVWRLDRARRQQGNYVLDLSATWMAPLITARTSDDLAALTAALAAAGADPVAADAAYAALHVDAARIIAAQPWAEAAYVQRHGSPLTAGEVPYTDEFEGRNDSHWFYRVAARSEAGTESTWSAPTPPVCSPDVVPPPAPVGRLALAADLAVTVSWLPVPAADLDHYLLYRGRDDTEVADPRELVPLLTLPAAGLPAGPVQVSVPCDPGAWRFRVVAVDSSGNRSRPSQILAGHALLPPPAAPEWTGATRDADTVQLTWRPAGNPAADPRLACLVERRPAGTGVWGAVSGWLPRATYAFTDAPPDPDAGWDYRLRVRDALGQVAATLPTTTVPER
jgi:hypothetical protein